MNNKSVLVVAPHPDDETLGCGGTLLMLKSKKYEINWLIVTEISESQGFSIDNVNEKNEQIDKVINLYEFDRVLRLGIPTTRVDEVSRRDLVEKISNIFNDLKPGIIFLPFINDVHTDHKVIAEAAISCTKWFRYPFIETVLYYETLSETEFNIDSTTSRFKPNIYIDISEYLDEKIRIMETYKSEINEFPFPRSEKAVRSLAYLRGAQCGAEAAEAFELLRSNIRF